MDEQGRRDGNRQIYAKEGGDVDRADNQKKVVKQKKFAKGIQKVRWRVFSLKMSKTAIFSKIGDFRPCGPYKQRISQNYNLLAIRIWYCNKYSTCPSEQVEA